MVKFAQCVIENTDKIKDFKYKIWGFKIKSFENEDDDSDTYLTDIEE